MLTTIHKAAAASAVIALALATASVPVAADAHAAKEGKRIIEEIPPGDHQVTYNAFRLKGIITEPQADGTVLPYVGKIHIQRKKCAKCGFKTVKKLKTDASGKYKTRIYAPEKGNWKWRTKVKASNGFDTTIGRVWTLYFK